MANPSDQPLLSQAPSERNSLLAAFLAAMRGDKLGDDNMLPAIVISFDRAKNEATVKPLIKVVRVDDTIISRNELTRINVLSIGGGGFHISFPLKAGDLGWVFASDRDISLWKQSLEESPPNTGRLHKFEDGWFVPDVMRKYIVDADDSESMVIQSVDGLNKVSISDERINILAATLINIEAGAAIKMTAESLISMDTASASASGNFSVGTGASGTFGTPTGQTVIVQNGIITSIT